MRGRVSLAGLAVLGRRATGQHLDLPAPLGRGQVREPMGKVLAWLLEKENPDGSWVKSTLDGTLEMVFSIESFYDWQVAANSIACLALLGAGESDSRTAALERGIHWLEETRPPKRGNTWDIDYVWS